MVELMGGGLGINSERNHVASVRHNCATVKPGATKKLQAERSC